MECLYNIITHFLFSIVLVVVVKLYREILYTLTSFSPADQRLNPTTVEFSIIKFIPISSTHHF